MALNLPTSCPIFAPLLNLSPTDNAAQNRPPTEVRFARWNNANAEIFNQRRRAQQEIGDDIRRERRFESAISFKIANDVTCAKEFWQWDGSTKWFCDP
ncbi:hypothetical protein ACFX2G_035197 [Malus domestica]